MTDPTPETLRTAKELARLALLPKDFEQDFAREIAQALTEAVQESLEAAAKYIDCEGSKDGKDCSGNPLLKDGTCVRSCSSDCEHDKAQGIRALKPQPPASQGTGGLVGELVEALKKARDNINLANGDSRPGQKAWSGDFLINEIDAALARAKAREAGKDGEVKCLKF